MRGSRPVTVALAVVLALTAACTDTTRLPESEAEDTPAVDATPDEGPWDIEPIPPGEDQQTAPICRGMYSEGDREPVVLVTHHTRPPLDLSVRMARDVLLGSVDSWRQIGGGPGRLRVVDAVSSYDDPDDDVQLLSPWAAIEVVSQDRSRVGVVPATAVTPMVKVVDIGGVDPITRPRDYPGRTTGTDCLSPVVTMTVVGDLMLGRGVAAAADRPGAQLEAMADRLRGSDITVGNLESTLSRAGAPTQGNDSFAAEPAVAGAMAAAGIDVLSLANNHLGDYGDRALVQTVRRLKRAGVATFGAGRDPVDAWEPVIVEREGITFGFLGFNAIGETPEVAPGRPGAVSVSMPPRTGPLDRAELRRFLRAVADLDTRVDTVVTMPHWGTQYTNAPEPVQRHVARRLVDAGADLVVGGHPHWVQGSQIIEGPDGPRLVVHSLGNFVFDMDFMDETMEGLVLELAFWGGELKTAEFVPYAMDETFTPRELTWRSGRDILRRMWETSGRQFTLR